MKNKADDKVDRYSVLAGGVRRLHHVKIKVIPIVIGALGTVPDEQKGSRKKSRGTKDQLLVDKAITLEAKRKKRCLNMAW